MTSSQEYVHVVSKRDVKDHAVFPLSTSTLAPLAKSSVRVHTRLISMSANNLSYALGGHRLFWWDTFPVPSSAPEPYSDQEAWGIVPAWGYGEVVSSTVDRLPSGTLLWGYWPTSAFPVDLELEPIGTDNLRWREISSHRKRLMNIYQMYEVVPSSPSPTESYKATKALFCPAFSTSYHLNRHVFPRISSSNPQEVPKPIHPLGLIPNVDLPWSTSDADLRSTVLICLASNSKTAQPFTWQLLHERDLSTSGPLALIHVSSTPDLSITHPSLPIKNVSYTDLPSLLPWITSLSATRIATIDFGAPYSVVHPFQTLLETHPSLPSALFVMVGTKPPPSPAPATPAPSEKLRELQRVQFNTSTVRDAVFARDGIDTYFADIDACFARYVAAAGVEGEVARAGVADGFGEGGIEEAWERLLRGGEKALMVFQL